MFFAGSNKKLKAFYKEVLNSGLTVEKTAKRMDAPVTYAGKLVERGGYYAGKDTITRRNDFPDRGDFI
ncbi:hypothetical protein [Lacrimispora sp.]|jgi:hypothetical protein|uniref:hypothetical protein n=1 Tax=Lacrimispora sp. TaxID=2719234 RepID=UPI0028AE5A46|nr:hypothetical protein [Lacrimispora sp.]